MKASDTIQSWRHFSGLIALNMLLTLASGCADARPTAQRNECSDNLRAIYGALQAYVTSHHDVPRDEKGNVALGPLTNADGAKNQKIGSRELTCPASRNSSGDSYIVNPKMTTGDLKKHSSTILVADKPENHGDCVVVLLGDGSIRVVFLALEEREEWARQFLAGENDAVSYPIPGEPDE